jgi:hypothetical protein
MNISSPKNVLQDLANSLPWTAILIPVGYSLQMVEILDSGELLLEWTYEKDGLFSRLQTWNETDPAMIVDNDHDGPRNLTKFDAVLKLYCGEIFLIANSLLTETIVTAQNPIDKIGRRDWSDYWQSFLEMAPQEDT